MYTRPPTLSDATIVEAVVERWGLEVDRAEYAPLGFGSHHWFVGTAAGWDRFVTVDDLSAKVRSRRESLDRAFERLDAAMTTARVLADKGHGFVVAPEKSLDGTVVHRLDARFTVSCFAFLDGVAGEHGEFRTGEDRRAVASHLVTLHELDPAVAPQCNAEDFELPARDELERALDDTEATWASGPFADDVLALLGRYAVAVRRSLDRFDATVRDALQSRDRWCITHGEPHGSNALAVDGAVRLIDWDTVLVAPCERDVWHLGSDDVAAADHYRRAGGRSLDHGLLRLYRLHWDLTEVAGYTALFRTPHEDTADTRASLANLEHYLHMLRT